MNPLDTSATTDARETPAQLPAIAAEAAPTGGAPATLGAAHDPTTASARPLPNLICPLCGGPNGCAPAACGRFDVDCWCRDARFAPELLQRLPLEARGNVCICARCAAGQPGTGAQD